MAKTILYGTCKEQECEGLPYGITLEYYLLEDLLCEAYSDLKRYGITIKKIAENSDGKRFEEAKQINDIFYSYNDATSFMNYLIEHQITPGEFRGIVEDYIADKISL